MFAVSVLAPVNRPLSFYYVKVAHAVLILLYRLRCVCSMRIVYAYRRWRQRQITPLDEYSRDSNGFCEWCTVYVCVCVCIGDRISVLTAKNHLAADVDV